MSRARTSVLAGALLLAAAASGAATLVDTGTPGGSAVGAYALDCNDAYAGAVTFAQTTTVQGIATHLLGVAAGETYTFAVLAQDAAQRPGAVLYTTRATATGDGWNGVSSLAGWTLAAGSYWFAIEVAAGDTLGSASVTGALLDRGAPAPLSRTAFNAGSGWQATGQSLSFGLRIEGVTSAVPEPMPAALALAGALLAACRSRARRAAAGLH